MRADEHIGKMNLGEAMKMNTKHIFAGNTPSQLEPRCTNNFYDSVKIEDNNNNNQTKSNVLHRISCLLHSFCCITAKQYSILKGKTHLIFVPCMRIIAHFLYHPKSNFNWTSTVVNNMRLRNKNYLRKVI